MADEKTIEGLDTSIKAMQRILNGIHNNNYIILGECRSCRTSLLSQLEHHLNRLSATEERYFFLPVLFSLQGVTEECFFSFLARQVQLSTMIPPQNLAEDSFNDIELEIYLDQVCKELEARHPDRQVRLVLLIDEMDVFSNYTPHIHDCFRSLFCRPAGEFLRMIMTGLSLCRVLRPRTSPWYNLFEELYLSPLSDDKA